MKDKTKVLFTRLKKWFYPGIKVKRWVLLLILGLGLLISGLIRVLYEGFYIIKKIDIIISISGVILVILGLWKISRSVLNIFLPNKEDKLIDVLYKKRYLGRGPKIAILGGGNGLSTLLKGIKEYTSNITAIVTVADSGGSTGRLRKEFDIQAPGDIRNCMVALADAPELMGDLFQYRFKKDSDLMGHNFGNLFITAMTQVTGDFEKAVEESSKILAIRGKVLPSTLDKVSLVAEYEDGSSIEGEAEIPNRHLTIKRVYLKPISDSSASKKVKAAQEALKAIKEADLIIIGPGSLYTSILPNLVIKEITEKIVNSNALKIYICNVMTQYGETDGYSASEHLKKLIKHTHPKIIDYFVVNTGIPPPELLTKYQEENSFPTHPDIEVIKELGYKIAESSLISNTDFVRHDCQKLANIIMNIFRKEIGANHK